MREAVWWVLATAVGLLVFEGVLRLLPVPTRYFVIPMQSNCLQRSASLGTEFRPNCAATWTAFILTGSQSTAFRINSLGLRDSEIDDDGAERILAIGDSCTWGWQVAQDEAYPQVLQRLLESRFGPGRYRVINAGTPGYTSHQGLVYLRERGLALHPAVVIFGYARSSSGSSSTGTSARGASPSEPAGAATQGRGSMLIPPILVALLKRCPPVVRLEAGPGEPPER